MNQYLLIKKISRLNKIIFIITFITIIFATFAICVGLNLISIGDTGISFNF